MNDRELLELAAKSAGFEVHARWQKDRDDSGNGDVGLWLTNGTTCWNPLTNDGQALRLAVAAGINMHVDPLDDDGNPVTVAKAFGLTACIERHHSDPFAATRRAITRAAAEIGRSM